MTRPGPDRAGQRPRPGPDRAGLDGPRPEPVTVTAVPGFAAEELTGAGTDADMLVPGSRGAGGFTPLMTGPVAGQVTRHAHGPALIVAPENRS